MVNEHPGPEINSCQPHDKITRVFAHYGLGHAKNVFFLWFGRNQRRSCMHLTTL